MNFRRRERRDREGAWHAFACRRDELHRQWHAQWHEKVQGKRRWRRSLRIRLVMMFVLLAVVMTGVFLAGMKKSFSTGWAEAAQPMLVDYADRLVAELGTPPDVSRAQALVDRLPITIRIVGPTVNWDSNPGEHGTRGGWMRDHDESMWGDKWFIRPTADGHRVIFGWAPRLWQIAPRAAGWATLSLLLLLVVLGYAYVSRLLRPLIDIREGAQRFGRGDFERPIPVRRNDDIGDLAEHINTMAHDIQAMLDAKRGLLLALSHELRSPLTRARLNAELLPSTAEGRAEREALLRDLNEMRDLISDLLESERLASPHAALQRERIDLAALVRETVAEMPAAREVHLDLAEGLPAHSVDRMRIRLLVRNLLDNALRYSTEAPRPPSVSVRAVLEGQAQGVEIEVRDFGPGVDEAQLERLTEAFYRTDGARQRATGGVGLGMYLCRLIAEAHGGSLRVRNASPGLQIVVRLG
ncbi:histidine kinase [Variovorax paradoxus]|jgi:signal transduction histidine kinase|uniref:HAMP domain-containing sensor histidine kinase n=1 Tax=Variovorax TaxID=34072 RepID=UPI0006E544DA|nr:HAMP domain-containing sensor histidine kinase [Variovorax sp. CY25R-8]KPU91059.1 histidine kinase [Variovorax paradoxus]KPU98825.1 histidine kinase [Variovorax paradoxus]KPV05284.1 histidine kinase [Variovorax paradoxus]KPV15859.1 histidine kinase [Variovorax paradoxus]KPV24579.1 histidine kinase [Variovorax paradoxus]